MGVTRPTTKYVPIGQVKQNPNNPRVIKDDKFAPIGNRFWEGIRSENVEQIRNIPAQKSIYA